MKFLKKIRNDILISKVSLKPIIKNLIQRNAFRLIIITLYFTVFVLCIILVYKVYYKQYYKKRYIQTKKENYYNGNPVLNSQREYEELKSQLVRLNQSIENMDLKINKLLLLCDSVSPRY